MESQGYNSTFNVDSLKLTTKANQSTDRHVKLTVMHTQLSIQP